MAVYWRVDEAHISHLHAYYALAYTLKNTAKQGRGGIPSPLGFSKRRVSILASLDEGNRRTLFVVLYEMQLDT